MQGDPHRPHISGQFNAELDAIKQHLLEMGGLVERTLPMVTERFSQRRAGG